MRVSFEVVSSDGDLTPLMNLKMPSGQPAIGDQIVAIKEDGSRAVFKVAEHSWVFQETENGVTMQLKVLLFQLYSSPGPESQEDEPEPGVEVREGRGIPQG